MSNQNIARAWKDPFYRASLTEAEQASLPAHPAGGMQLSNAEPGVRGKGREFIPTFHRSCFDCGTSSFIAC